MPKAYSVTVGAMFCWALLSVASRILLLTYEFDPWMFSFIQLCAGGVTLLLLSAKSGLDARSFLRPVTWLLGAFRVVSAALYTTTLSLISVLEAGILGTLNLPVIVVAVWLLSRKRPRGVEWLGHLLILGAIAFLVRGLEAEIRFQAAWLMGLNALCLAAITLLSERHPDNISDDAGARARFAGTVLLITAAFFLVIRFAQNGLTGGPIELPLLISGITVGILLRAPAMFLAFWSIRLAGAMGYTAAVTLLPIFGMAIEQAAVGLGLLDETRFRMETLGLALVMISGTLLVVLSRRKSKPLGDIEKV
ncbi:MAG: EamA family transporter [Rhodobacteraceae bacterium]|nr:EamA family transporter [Paracoccaceae bacterium]